AGAPLAPATGITLNATKTGIRLADANEFLQLGDPANVNKDFALGGDIDLTNTGTAWTGPAGYIGHFYGNGYTIKGLVLSSTSTSVGLFSTLGNGAIVENFTLEVSTPGNAVVNFTSAAATYIGGLLGRVDNGLADITIENVHIKGELKIGKAVGVGGGLYFGGFIGEARNFHTINIIRCSSEVNIEETYAFTCMGGFIGRQYINSANAALNFIDCYASGNISAETDFSCSVGAFMGDIVGNSGITITFDRCYASGNVEVKNSGTLAAGVNQYASGFVGAIGTNTNLSTVEIKNNVAASSKVISPLEAEANQGRLAGYIRAGTNVTFTNNIANIDMRIGDGSSTHSDTPSDSAGTTKWGKGVQNTTASGGLKNAVTWTALGWSNTVWDFDGLTKSGADFYWPKLK
ncbi:MAG: hypothetical protein LBG79_04735, partial [Spirochaetaceae bacterium]|nr:hypothetical protein [Spirochaetaceae bacterium]